MGPRLVGRAIEPSRERPVEDFVDERGLARPADAGDRDEGAERERDVDVLEVVGRGPADDERAAVAGPARGRPFDAPGTSQVETGRRLAGVGQQLLRRPLEDHRTAVRNIRRDGNERLKKMLKDKQISEDAERDALDEIQKLTNTYITKIDELAKGKEQEITNV